MADWKNTKCGNCVIQRKSKICNSCMSFHLYRPMTNADKIRAMSDEELAEFLAETELHGSQGKYEDYLKWIQSEAEG